MEVWSIFAPDLGLIWIFRCTTFQPSRLLPTLYMKFSTFMAEVPKSTIILKNIYTNQKLDPCWNNFVHDKIIINLCRFNIIIFLTYGLDGFKIENMDMFKYFLSKQIIYMQSGDRFGTSWSRCFSLAYVSHKYEAINIKNY